MSTFGGYLFRNTEPWNLPLLPSRLPQLNTSYSDPGSMSRIPKTIWVSFKKAPKGDEELVGPWAHLRQMKARNPTWAMHLMGSDEQQQFMEEHFSETSLLWAFKAVNPAVGVPHSDIWRYAVVWLYGGVYIDDDSDIRVPFDAMIANRSTASMILGVEGHKSISDYCYRDSYHLSTASIYERYQNETATTAASRKPAQIYGSKVLLQWAFFAEPRHPILLRVLKNIVELFRLEYLRESALHEFPADKSFLQIMCTTGPQLFTMSVRELMYATIYQKQHGNTSLSSPYNIRPSRDTEVFDKQGGEPARKSQPPSRSYEAQGLVLEKRHIPHVLEDPCFKAIQGVRKISNKETKFQYYMHRMSAYRLNLLESYTENFTQQSLESRYIIALRNMSSAPLPYNLPPITTASTSDKQQMLSLHQAVENGKWRLSGDIYRVLQGQLHAFPSVCAAILSQYVFARHVLAPIPMKEYQLEDIIPVLLPRGGELVCDWYKGGGEVDTTTTTSGNNSTTVVDEQLAGNVTFVASNAAIAASSITSSSSSSRKHILKNNFNLSSEKQLSATNNNANAASRRRLNVRNHHPHPAREHTQRTSSMINNLQQQHHPPHAAATASAPASHQHPPPRDVIQSLGVLISHDTYEFSLILKDCGCRRWEVRLNDNSVKKAAKGWRTTDLAARAIIVDKVFYDRIPVVGSVSETYMHGLSL